MRLQDIDFGELASQVDSLYSDYDQHSNLLKERAQTVNEVSSSGSLVYGELTTPVRLFEALDLCAEDIFVDMGSGRGQVVIAAANYSKAPRSSIGLEFVPTRHRRAAEVITRCSDAVWVDRVRFECCNALEHEAVTMATKVLLCNATFEDDLNRQFAAALALSHAPKLQKVAMLKPLDAASLAMAELHLSAITAIAGSWAAEGTPLHIYSRANFGTGAVSPVYSKELLRLLSNDASSADEAAISGVRKHGHQDPPSLAEVKRHVADPGHVYRASAVMPRMLGRFCLVPRAMLQAFAARRQKDANGRQPNLGL